MVAPSRSTCPPKIWSTTTASNRIKGVINSSLPAYGFALFRRSRCFSTIVKDVNPCLYNALKSYTPGKYRHVILHLTVACKRREIACVHSSIRLFPEPDTRRSAPFEGLLRLECYRCMQRYER
jgi:hypothetical protein